MAGIFSEDLPVGGRPFALVEGPEWTPTPLFLHVSPTHPKEKRVVVTGIPSSPFRFTTPPISLRFFRGRAPSSLNTSLTLPCLFPPFHARTRCIVIRCAPVFHRLWTIVPFKVFAFFPRFKTPVITFHPPSSSRCALSWSSPRTIGSG